MLHPWTRKHTGFAAFALLLAACGNDEPPLQAGDFVSDNPAGGGDGGANESGGEGGAGDDGGEDPGDDDGGGDREIAEADIIKVDGDTLYAISEYGGLSVIDVSNPNQLPVLGRHQDSGRPFEMYVENDRVFVMYNDFGTYDWDAELEAWSWRTSSKLVALDASDPAAIREIGTFELPGTIQDSRRVGDVLYLVTYENGECWGCQDAPNTTVTSLDIANLGQIGIVDQLSIEAPEVAQDEWWWGGQRSVTTTTERMYIGGLEWSSDPRNSIIDVIDISAPDGSLRRGTSITVAGEIQSRWQMDEYEGVLRVISQPGFWNPQEPPVVQTFTIASTDEITPLASLPMVLPRPEALQTVRFDGPRGYAITFERTDPLFTLDLSDPSAPVQRGELEIPGWVYHIEPRGDELLALGFDQGNAEGAINVSTFDVSDFANPVMTERVNFGGEWASFAEDQNRIHKAFAILEELGLLLVPFSGWDYSEDECWGTYLSGVQLVDWQPGDLTLRGVAPSDGQARRAFVHRDHLFGVSDMAVESFDITDRDAPVRRGSTALATKVEDVTTGDGYMIRYARDWWTDRTRLEIVDASTPSVAEPIGSLDLDDLVERTEGECWETGYWAHDLRYHEGYVYLFREVWSYEYGDDKNQSRIDVIDVRDPAAPVFVRTVELPHLQNWGSYWSGIDHADEQIIAIGDVLVANRQWWVDAGTDGYTQASIVVIDLSDPSDPKVAAELARPEGLGHGGLLRFGDGVVTWHVESANEDGSRVRYYLDRIDLSDPTEPTLLDPINVPGMVVAYDAASNRAITVDTRVERLDLADEYDCWGRPKAYNYDYEAKQCLLVHRTPKLVRILDGGAALLDELELETDDTQLTAMFASSTRVFAQLRRGSWGHVAENDGGSSDYEIPTDEIAVLTGLTENELREASRPELRLDGFWLDAVAAVADRLVYRSDNGVGVLDAADAEQPEVTMHELNGYGCWNMQIEGDRAYCPMGPYGLQVVPLAD